MSLRHKYCDRRLSFRDEEKKKKAFKRWEKVYQIRPVVDREDKKKSRKIYINTYRGTLMMMIKLPIVNQIKMTIPSNLWDH